MQANTSVEKSACAARTRGHFESANKSPTRPRAFQLALSHMRCHEQSNGWHRRVCARAYVLPGRCCRSACSALGSICPQVRSIIPDGGSPSFGALSFCISAFAHLRSQRSFEILVCSAATSSTPPPAVEHCGVTSPGLLGCNGVV